MFYGSGAGKLPTASAVVGDIVEAAKNLDRNLGNGWSSEKLELEKKDAVEHQFFVRMKGEKEAFQERIAESFGAVQYVKVPGIDGEFGFVTGVMPEGTYNEKAAAYKDDMIAMIRVEG